MQADISDQRLCDEALAFCDLWPCELGARIALAPKTDTCKGIELLAGS